MKRIAFILLNLLTINATAQVPTFNGDVAAIIFNKCSLCHRTGEIGPFPLTNYTEVSNAAASISDAINEKRMPPWMPDSHYSHFVGERVLTDLEIQKINDWISFGMPEGSSIQLPPFPQFSTGSQIGTPDLQLNLEHYTINSATDQYRCFVVPSGFQQDQMIQAIEFMAGNKEVDHHAEIFWDTTGICAQSDAADSLPGYASPANIIGSSNAHLIFVWVPGAAPFVLPEDFGFKIPANADIVVQLHYRAGGQGLIDSSHLNIFFQQNSLCREVKTIIKNHPGSGFLNPPFFIPHDSIRTFYSVDTMKTKFSFLGIMPHMHQVGASTITYSMIGTDTLKMIYIPKWNFYWQNTYMFQKVVVLPVDAVVHTESTYDNTTNNIFNPFYPPQDIVLGFATDHEMFLTAYYYVSYEPGDENIYLDTPYPNETSQQSENGIEVFPNPFSLNFNGEIFSEQNDLAEISIFNLSGKKVITISKSYLLKKGINYFNSGDLNLQSGIYFLSVRGNSINRFEKIAVIK